jgi:DNA polymerase-3 subunit delta'
MQFKEIQGHEHIKSQLIKTVQEQRVSHAQLFLGPQGNGGLALAIAYAQYINCEAPTADDSCGTCGHCRKYQKLIHPDLHFSYPFFVKHKEDTATTFIQSWREAFLKNPYLGMEDWRGYFEAENKQANINIAEAHDIIKKLSLKSFESKYKVLIMWLPEYLDKQGNALLKLIEEPPENTLFILVAENSDLILNTILSRTQLVKIKAYDRDQIVKYLEAYAPQLPHEQIEEISLMSEGSLTRARSYVDELAEPFFETMVQWLRYCVTDAGNALIPFCENNLAILGRENQKSFLKYTLSMMRSVMLEQVGAGDLQSMRPEAKSFVGKFAARYSVEQIEEMSRVVEEAIFHIERNANAKLLFLDLSLRLVLLFKYNTFRKKADSTI